MRAEEDRGEDLKKEHRLESYAKKRLLYLNLSIFTAALSISLWTPLLPVYAQKLGATYLDIGVIGAAGGAPYMILPFIVGSLSDRYGRKRFYYTGLALTAATSALFVITNNVQQVTLVRAFSGIAYSFIWPSAEALISDLTTLAERTRNLGYFTFSWALGMLVAPPIGGRIVQTASFTTLFLTSLVVGIAATIFAVYGLKTFGEAGTQNKTSRSKANTMTILLPVFLVAVALSAALGVVFNILPAHLNNLGIDPFQIGVIFAALGLTRAITFSQTSYATKIGENLSMMIGLVILAVSLFATSTATMFAEIITVVVFLGVGMGILGPLSISVTSKIATKEKTGAAIGATECFFGLGLALGPLMGGAVAETLDPTAPYIITAIVALACVIPLARTMARRSTM